jgi:hypothetical protein
MFRKYVLYLVRWQLSTPILAVCVWLMTQHLGATTTTVIANFIGGLIFFWVDRWIFRKTDILRGEVWERQFNITCADCGKDADLGYRLVRRDGYDRSGDQRPQFRCAACSQKKYERDHGPAGWTVTPAGAVGNAE